MNRTLWSLIFIATATGLIPSTSISATTVYKCANSYSQTPCHQGQAITIDDHRDAAQKQQAEAASQRDAELANTLKKDRLTQQRIATKPKATAMSKPAQANATKADASRQTPATIITPKRIKPPGHKPVQFVAEVPGTHKPVKAEKKSANAQVGQ